MIKSAPRPHKAWLLHSQDLSYHSCRRQSNPGESALTQCGCLSANLIFSRETRLPSVEAWTTGRPCLYKQQHPLLVIAHPHWHGSLSTRRHPGYLCVVHAKFSLLISHSVESQLTRKQYHHTASDCEHHVHAASNGERHHHPDLHCLHADDRGPSSDHYFQWHGDHDHNSRAHYGHDAE
jgi:hypothetical protein